MTNLFDDPDGTYLVLMNEDSQYSLWATFTEVPAGWHIAHSQDTGRTFLDHIDTHWIDMGPQSHIDVMNSQQ